jgi:hypothetical protein
LLDKHIPTHGHLKGLSVVWLAHILSQAVEAYRDEYLVERNMASEAHWPS